jgi:hypothetical protein
MKKMSLVLSVLALQFSAAAFAGGVTSNGPVGREFFHCHGPFHFSRDNAADVDVSVAPVQGQGLNAIVTFSEETRIQRQFRKVNMLSNGAYFQGSTVKIVIQNIQSPNRQPGHFNAQFTFSEYSPFTSTLDCTRN